ncbi:hypothetical protein AB1Y20_013465 [Prymnesium parvum]|uniref:Uncharacterized protein n=1 Tax=Prymnesium parvum TaxID=97485 RepID=A0AB34IHT6_PRYPA
MGSCSSASKRVATSSESPPAALPTIIQPPKSPTRPDASCGEGQRRALEQEEGALRASANVLRENYGLGLAQSVMDAREAEPPR